MAGIDSTTACWTWYAGSAYLLVFVATQCGRALRMSEKLKAGTVWVNTYRAVSFMPPFGGYKRSGHGRELARFGLHEFMNLKTVMLPD